MFCRKTNHVAFADGGSRVSWHTRAGEGFAAFNLVFRLISVGRAGGDDSDMVGARLVARVHCSSRSISG